VTTLTDLPTERLVPHERNLRSGVGDISDLQASITAVGILQPLLVVPLPDDHPCRATLEPTVDGYWFQIIIGHRRHAAARELGLGTVPCLLAADEGEADRVVKMLAENVHRQGLSTTALSGIASGASFDELGVVAA
jgi:ParB family transcriptional regulator, chromosome partitioning protein